MCSHCCKARPCPVVSGEDAFDIHIRYEAGHTIPGTWSFVLLHTVPGTGTSYWYVHMPCQHVRNTYVPGMSSTLAGNIIRV